MTFINRTGNKIFLEGQECRKIKQHLTQLFNLNDFVFILLFGSILAIAIRVT